MLVGIDASRAVSPSPTGTENYSRELIRALLDLDRTNFYWLYTRRTVARDFFSQGDFQSSAENFEIRALEFPRLWTHARLSIEMLMRPPDVLFVPAHVVPIVHPRRTIVTIHDLGHLHFPNAYPARQRFYHRWSAERNIRVASHIFADSQATKGDIVNFLHASPEKITVIYPAYDARVYQPVRDTSRTEQTKSRFRIEGDYILAVGTIHPRKNYLRLMQAIERLSKSERLKLVIVGKRGWLHKPIVEHAQSLNLSITFLDYVQPSDMPALIGGARLFVFPSLHEGFGLPILEAQACGVPVVCSNSSSLPEAAGDAAVFFDPTDVDAIAQALRVGLCDESLRENLIARGFENVKRFSWESSASAALKVLCAE